MDPLIATAAVSLIAGAVGSLALWLGVGIPRLKAWADKRIAKEKEEIGKELDSRMEAVLSRFDPFLQKAERAMDSLGNLEALPATMAEGMKPVAAEIMQEQVKPLLQSLMNGVTAQLNEALERVENLGGKLLPVLAPTLAAGNKAFSQMGVDAKQDKAAGREAVENILKELGPARGLAEKFLKTSKGSDPLAFMDELSRFKPIADRFVPGLFDQIIKGILTGQPSEGNAVGSIMGLVTTANPASSESASYMKA